MQGLKSMVPAALLLLGACATDDVGLGDAVRHNLRVAVVDLVPAPPVVDATTGNAARDVGAQRRYAKGSVYDLIRPTQNVFLPGSGSGLAAPK